MSRLKRIRTEDAGVHVQTFWILMHIFRGLGITGLTTDNGTYSDGMVGSLIAAAQRAVTPVQGE